MTKRILVVDDDAASCELLREIFAGEGWEAESAQTPEAAIGLFAIIGGGREFTLTSRWRDRFLASRRCRLLRPWINRQGVL